MEYSVTDLIGMLNLGLIIANGQNDDKVHLPKDAVRELVQYMQDLKDLLGE